MMIFFSLFIILTGFTNYSLAEDEGGCTPSIEVLNENLAPGQKAMLGSDSWEPLRYGSGEVIELVTREIKSGKVVPICASVDHVDRGIKKLSLENYLLCIETYAREAQSAYTAVWYCFNEKHPFADDSDCGHQMKENGVNSENYQEVLGILKGGRDGIRQMRSKTLLRNGFRPGMDLILKACAGESEEILENFVGGQEGGYDVTKYCGTDRDISFGVNEDVTASGFCIAYGLTQDKELDYFIDDVHHILSMEERRMKENYPRVLRMAALGRVFEQYAKYVGGNLDVPSNCAPFRKGFERYNRGAVSTDGHNLTRVDRDSGQSYSTEYKRKLVTAARRMKQLLERAESHRRMIRGDNDGVFGRSTQDSEDELQRLIQSYPVLATGFDGDAREAERLPAVDKILNAQSSERDNVIVGLKSDLKKEYADHMNNLCDSTKMGDCHLISDRSLTDAVTSVTAYKSTHTCAKHECNKKMENWTEFKDAVSMACVPGAFFLPGALICGASAVIIAGADKHQAAGRSARSQDSFAVVGDYAGTRSAVEGDQNAAQAILIEGVFGITGVVSSGVRQGGKVLSIAGGIGNTRGAILGAESAYNQINFSEPIETLREKYPNEFYLDDEVKRQYEDVLRSQYGAYPITRNITDKTLEDLFRIEDWIDDRDKFSLSDAMLVRQKIVQAWKVANNKDDVLKACWEYMEKINPDYLNDTNESE